MTRKTNKKKSHRDLENVKFGEHLIFDAYGCDPGRLDSLALCNKIMRKMAELANMKILADPYTVHADSNETLGGKDPGGFSGFLIIQESHISIHTFVRRGFVTVDLYSCKPFEVEPIIQYLKKSFKPKDYDVIKLDRGLKYPADNIH